MPKHGPREASRMQIAAFFPILFKPSPRQTVVVVLPSPAGVGLIAVTKINFPLSFACTEFINSWLTLALSWPYGSKCSDGIPSFDPIS